MKRTEKRDSKIPGLVLTTLPTGFRTWSVRYVFAGHDRRLTLGDARKISTLTARKTALDIFAKVARGEDPQSTKTKQRARARAGLDKPATVGATWQDYIAAGDWKPTTRTEIERVGRTVILPKLGRLELADLTARQCKTLAKTNQQHSTLTGFLNWCVHELIIPKSPLEGVRKPRAKVERDRVLTEPEIRIFWEACGKIGPPFGPIFRALLLTGCRRNEIAGLQLDWVNGATKTIAIPGEATKNGRALDVHITRQLSTILEGWTYRKPSGWSRAKRRLDKAMAKEAVLVFEGQVPAWRLHDLRRTAASGMAQLGVSLPVIERCLNHVSGPSFGGVAGIYQRHTFAPEMVAAWTLWADHLEKICAPLG